MKKGYLAIGLVFIAALSGLSLTSFAVKDRNFSENENRYLAQIPHLSMADILSGEFQENLEDYLNDQIWARDVWITIKTAIQKDCGNRDIGGAYIGKDGYDFEKILPENIDETLVARNIKSVKRYFDKAKEVVGKEHLSFVLVPTSGLVLENNLPANAILFDQKAYIKEIEDSMGEYSFVNPEEDLRKYASEGVYYHTDHHWTTKGAFLTCKQWCENVKNTVPQESDYDVKTVTDVFRGSLYSKVLDFDSTYDTIECMKKKNTNAYDVIADSKVLNGFYQEDKLKTKDKYAYFFGGNYGEVAITNLNWTHDEQKNLLVIKDSFANAFVPLIADQYSHIYMIDLRYYSGDMISYLNEQKITDVLVLYNISNFVTDKNVFKLIGRS